VRAVLQRIAILEERRRFMGMLSSSFFLGVIVVAFCYETSILLVEMLQGITGNVLAGVIEEPSLLLAREIWLALGESPIVFVILFMGALLLLFAMALRRFMRLFSFSSPLFHALS
jgi:hypothetical protein